MGWSGGAIVLGNLPVPARPTNLVDRRASAVGAVDFFLLSTIYSLFFLTLSGRRSDIDGNTVSMGR